MDNKEKRIILDSGEDLRSRIQSETRLPISVKQELLDIIDQKRLAPLTSDTIAKKNLSPDLYPERFDFLMQRIMNDDTLCSNGSATNEPPVDTLESKKIITDIPSWLKDGRFANIEMQQIAQKCIFNRMDIYSSRILMLQYSASKEQAKGDINYNNLPGVVMIVLMKESPDIFKSHPGNRYIHRIKDAVTDTGLKFPMLRNIAFVQLDKALEQFINCTYNEDEDIELLAMLALIADINNTTVQEKIKDNPFLVDLFTDVTKCSTDREVQLMLFDEDLEIMTMNSFKVQFREEGAEERQKKLNTLYSWLYENNRDNDVKKAVKDKVYLDKLLEEYEEAHKAN